MMIPDLADHPQIHFHRYKKGEIILAQGEEAEYVFYLVNGVCYRTLITDKGDEIVHSVKRSGGIMEAVVGVLTLFGNNHKSSASFIAHSCCEGYLIPKQVFLNYVDQRPDLLKEIVNMAIDEHRRLLNDFQLRQEGRVANRLCQLLLEHSAMVSGRRVVDKAYTNAEMSRFLGIHKVTISRIIKSLKEEGVVSRGEFGLVIDNEIQLHAYADGEKVIYE